jgi:hypothetical protein
MEVSLGFFDSPDNILIRRFSLNKDFLGEETVRIEDLSTCNLDGLLLSSNELNEEIQNILKDELKFFPISKGQNLSLNFADFKTLNPLMSLNKLSEINGSWVLKNNLLLIEHLFETVLSLKNTLHKDRDSFLLELWYLIKNNLGAFDLVLYFNDLEKGKNLITKRKITGKKYPEIQNLSDADFKIVETYKAPSGGLIFYKEKQEFLINMDILGSPIILVGRCFNFSPLQKSLIKSLFKGLE